MLMSLFSSRLVAILVVVVASAGLARAQEPTPGHLAAARELITITNSLSAIQELLPQFAESIRRHNVTRPELTKDLEAVLESLKPEMELQRQQMINEAAKVYAKALTEAELKEVVAFFKTPSGQKYIKLQPDITDEIINAVQVWTQQVSEYVMVRTRAEMGKRGFQLQ
jgi:hypothetical protein